MPNILIINPQQHLLETLSETLESFDFTVIPCRTSEEALEELEQDNSINCLLSDLYLPGIDGWRLCRLLKGHDDVRLRNLPVLLYSHLLGGSDAVSISKELGAFNFFTVPTSPERLVQEINDALEGRVRLSKLSVELLTKCDKEFEKFQECLPASCFDLSVNVPQKASLTVDASVVCSDISLSDLASQSRWNPAAKGAQVWIAVKPTIGPVDLLPYIRQGFDSVISPMEGTTLPKLIDICCKQRSVLRVQEVESELQREAEKKRQSTGRLLSMFS